MKHLSSPEANILFTTALLIETTMGKLQKKFEDKEISAESYIQKRQHFLHVIKKFSVEIEDSCIPIVAKKAHTSLSKGSK